MQVAGSRMRKVIVYDEIYTFEVNTSTEQLSANKDPYFALSKGHERVLALLLCSIRVYHIHFDVFVNELFEKQVRLFFGIDENDQRWLESLLKQMCQN